MASKYLTIKTKNSFCPKCNKPAYLLCEGYDSKKPSFYICFDCHFVGEVGKGPVPVEIEKAKQTHMAATEEYIDQMEEHKKQQDEKNGG